MTNSELIHFDKSNWKSYIEHDFNRQIWCVLGFPIDNTYLEKVKETIDHFIDSKRQCVVSTVNLNFSDCAIHSDEFRHAVNMSDIGVIDGFPVFLVSKLLNMPIPERTSGSVLINYLLRNKWEQQYSVYWYGSGEGIAQKAYEETNKLETGHKAVGYHFPGYGTVSSMQQNESIKQINETNTDLLLLALSAKKGCVWIENNRKSTTANVLSHIGSVLDFFAGTESESPPWTRKIGMEWLWKAIMKPALFKRFFKEGMTFAKTLLFNVLPLKNLQRKYSHLIENPTAVVINTENSENTSIVKFAGSLTFSSYTEVAEQLKTVILSDTHLVLDLADVDYIDNSIIGLFMLSKKYQANLDNDLTIVNCPKPIGKIFKYNLVDTLLAIKD